MMMDDDDAVFGKDEFLDLSLTPVLPCAGFQNAPNYC